MTDITPSSQTKRHHLDRRAEEIADRLAGGDPDDLLRPQYVADKFSVSTQWLELGRAPPEKGGGYGPPFVTLGPRTVRYRRGDLLPWLHSRTKQFEKEKAAASKKRQSAKK